MALSVFLYAGFLSGGWTPIEFAVWRASVKKDESEGLGPPITKEVVIFPR
jgi:hypothetical protein